MQNKKIIQDRFTFFSNFAETIQDLPKNIQDKAYRAICEYGIYGILPDEPILRGICLMGKISIHKTENRGGNNNPNGNNQYSKNVGQNKNTVSEFSATSRGQKRSKLVKVDKEVNPLEIEREIEIENRNKKIEIETENNKEKENKIFCDKIMPIVSNYVIRRLKQVVNAIAWRQSLEYVFNECNDPLLERSIEYYFNSWQLYEKDKYIPVVSNPSDLKFKYGKILNWYKSLKPVVEISDEEKRKKLDDIEAQRQEIIAKRKAESKCYEQE